MGTAPPPPAHTLLPITCSSSRLTDNCIAAMTQEWLLVDPQVTASFSDHLMPNSASAGVEKNQESWCPLHPFSFSPPELHLLSVPSQEGSEQSRRLLRISGVTCPPPSSVLTGLEILGAPGVRCFIFLCFRVLTCGITAPSPPTLWVAGRLWHI